MDPSETFDFDKTPPMCLSLSSLRNLCRFFLSLSLSFSHVHLRHVTQLVRPFAIIWSQCRLLYVRCHRFIGLESKTLISRVPSPNQKKLLIFFFLLLFLFSFAFHYRNVYYTCHGDTTIPKIDIFRSQLCRWLNSNSVYTLYEIDDIWLVVLLLLFFVGLWHH